MTKADEELLTILKSQLTNEMRDYYKQYPDADKNDVIGYIVGFFARPQTKALAATERKKAVQQFAAEVKGKAKTMIVETMSESRAANRKWIEAVSVTAIDEALESYES